MNTAQMRKHLEKAMSGSDPWPARCWVSGYGADLIAEVERLRAQLADAERRGQMEGLRCAENVALDIFGQLRAPECLRAALEIHKRIAEMEAGR